MSVSKQRPGRWFKMALAWSTCLGWATIGFAAAPRVGVSIEARFSNAPLRFDALTHVLASGQRISVTRLDLLFSGLALRGIDGRWSYSSNRFAFISGREGRTRFELTGIPSGSYDRLRFNVGLPAEENHANPGGLAADDPLNPNVNGLHWSWQGGYVFLALEGGWRKPDGSTGGYSYHLATDRMLMPVELPLTLDLTGDREVALVLRTDRLFSAPNRIDLADESASTHSRVGDVLADRLRKNVMASFAVLEVRGPRSMSRKEPSSASPPVVAPNATPYPLTIPDYVPLPSLPADNPLTEEGVALGRRLFAEPLLSINSRQSCASCHQADRAFSENQTVSTGAEGIKGTRNAMPLLNLAWKRSFFWDGRAPTLRDQVLQPIQNPIEMHESLANVAAKLQASGFEHRASGIRQQPSDASYPARFAAAFGSPDITPDRVARALEQFLLVQTSFDSKFDRVQRGEGALTPAEERGFELFHTEYDPRRGQFGADCFHCHGGALFQSQGFANNGLDEAATDAGRSAVSGRDGDRGKFSVPSLRNVAVTAPYMHDGRFKTLEEAVEHYRSGVKPSASLDPNLAKHPAGGVPFSDDDKAALVAFLKTLTDARFEAGSRVAAASPSR
jgi:cytochrome c peroxidase